MLHYSPSFSWSGPIKSSTDRSRCLVVVVRAVRCRAMARMAIPSSVRGMMPIPADGRPLIRPRRRANPERALDAHHERDVRALAALSQLVLGVAAPRGRGVGVGKGGFCKREAWSEMAAMTRGDSTYCSPR